MLGLKTPLIVADRNDPRRVPKNWIIRLFRNIMYLFTDAIVVQTNNNKKYFSTWYKKDIPVIFNPVDLGGYTGKAINTKKVLSRPNIRVNIDLTQT